jgi:upstream activation factor subunit UAF30
MQESTKQPGRKGNAAMAKPVQPDEKLAAIVGSTPIPRTEITKKIWDYIKQHNLQDAKNRQRINADDKLKPVFDGREQVTMFEMTKLISGHMK